MAGRGCIFSMATQIRWLNGEGKHQSEKEWHPLVVKGKKLKTA